MAVAEMVATSGGDPSEKVNSFIIQVNGSEDTAASARSSLLWEKVRNCVTLLNGPKDAVSSAWTGLASYVAALMQRWRDKIIYCVVQRWIVAFFLAAVYIYRAIFIGGVGLVTVNYGLWLMSLLGKYLSSPDMPRLLVHPLPVISQAEFKPLARGLREYDFWISWMRITIVALVMSFFLRFPEGDVEWYMQVLFIAAFAFVFLGRPLWLLRHYNQFPFNLGMKTRTGKNARVCGSLAETKMGSTQAETRMAPSSDI